MSKGQSVNAIEFAQQLEDDGEKFYRELAEKTLDEGVKAILLGLAEDEVKHARVLLNLKSSVSPVLRQTEIIGKAKRIFSDMAVRKQFREAGNDQIILFRQALDMERQSRDFFLAQADEAKDEASKTLFSMLAVEEKYHAVLLENMIEFLSRPKTWLENAEFSHLDDY